MHGQPLASEVVRLASRLSSETSALSKSGRENVYRTIPRSGIP